MRSVSPWRSFTRATSSPSRSATICANVVSCDCPWFIVPLVTTTEPVVSMRISERSNPGTTVILRFAKASDP